MSCCLWILDGSNTTSSEDFEDDLEEKHLLPTSSVAEDTIVMEIHRWKSAESRVARMQALSVF
jgi:hypothetical protein